MEFKKDFIWGTATASYQIEGAAYADGKGLSVWDTFSHTPGKVFDGHTGDVGCNHYQHMEQDIALMADLGIRNYRFSVAWPRLLPEGFGSINEKGIDFYQRLIDTLLKYNIRPFMTLFHWDLPMALQVRGAWENPDIAPIFADYAQLCATRFGDRVKDFIPFNEPQCFIGLGNVDGIHAPGLKVPVCSSIPMSHHVLRANGLAMQRIRQLVPDAKLGYAPCQNPVIPDSDSPADVEAARKAYFSMSPEASNWAWNVTWWSDPMLLGNYPEDGLALYGKYLPKGWEKDLSYIHQKLDYYGQNIYQGDRIKAADNEKGFERVKHAVGIAKTGSQWPITPECLYWGPKFLYERYKTPIVITENGLSCNDVVSLDGKVHDPNRENYVHRYLLALRKAHSEGVDIAGYFYWSFLDNFEWAEGYKERFGLVYVDYQNQQRTVKDSAYWYKKVIQSNGEIL